MLHFELIGLGSRRKTLLAGAARAVLSRPVGVVMVLVHRRYASPKLDHVRPSENGETGGRREGTWPSRC